MNFMFFNLKIQYDKVKGLLHNVAFRALFEYKWFAMNCNHLLGFINDFQGELIISALHL